MEEAGDDAAYIAAALGDIARARGMAQLAKDTDISREGQDAGSSQCVLPAEEEDCHL